MITLANREILQYHEQLQTAFISEDYIPVVLRFYLKQNIAKLILAYNVITEATKESCEHFNGFIKDNVYHFLTPDDQKSAEQEYQVLLSLKQEIDISTVLLTDILDIPLTINQMKAIMFMIEDINIYKGDKGMKLTNLEIYSTFSKVNNCFTGEETLPVKLNYYFQRNNKTLMELARDIEEARLNIGKKYGVEAEGGYTIPEDKIEEANKEYEELMTCEQEVNICTISIEKIPDDLELTTAQMDALSYMIVE